MSICPPDAARAQGNDAFDGIHVVQFRGTGIECLSFGKVLGCPFALLQFGSEDGQLYQRNQANSPNHVSDTELQSVKHLVQRRTKRKYTHLSERAYDQNRVATSN